MDLTIRPKNPPPESSSFPLTVIVPAYNEAESVGDTIRSLQGQTVMPAEIIVVDDFSDDGTGDIAREFGVTVLRPEQNTGSKAGAQMHALPQVRTKYVMAIDADTTLEPNAIELLKSAFDDPNVAAACGYVLPRNTNTLWERGRYFEYLFAFGFYKQIQDYFGKPTISSGCFSMYRTDCLRKAGGWSTRTLAEDMDLTWTFYQYGWGVRFIPEAVSYPIEPHDLRMMNNQLRRWSHGLVQNLKLHWRGVLKTKYLRHSLGVMVWDATIATAAYFIFLPLIAIYLGQPWPLLGYLIDIPIVLVPVLAAAHPRREISLALLSVPGFLVLRVVNAIHFIEAVWSEIIRGKRFNTYVKGH